jgi:hypothetical protein
MIARLVAVMPPIPVRLRPKELLVLRVTVVETTSERVRTLRQGGALAPD